MTVAELIRELGNYEGHLEVFRYDDDGIAPLEGDKFTEDGAGRVIL